MIAQLMGGVPPLAGALGPAAATMGDIAFLGFGVVIVAVGALVAIALVKGAERERERLARFQAYAAQCGWAPVPAGTTLPGPVAEAARSRRSQLVLTCRNQDTGLDLWLVWHRWSETTSTGETTTTRTRHLTRYFLFPGRPLPDVRLSRRSRIGAALMPVRGIGTGDSAFDREFLIRGDAGPGALPLFTPELRQAMLGGALPAWEIKDGLLVTDYDDRPDIANLQFRADAAVRIARLLP